MATEFEAIKKLEQRLGIELPQLEKIDFSDSTNGYTIDCNNNIVGMVLKDCGITDISFLEDFPDLLELNLMWNKISDISVLKALPNLTSLNLNNNQISDISVLKALPNLKRLHLRSNQISDISVLKGLPKLTRLGLWNNQISGISELKALTNLTYLILGQNKIRDISVLKALPNLIELSLIQDQISDISALKVLTDLKKLHLNGNQISDISVLKILQKLTKLYLSRNQISDISVLKILPKLKTLWIGGNQQIRDISVLKSLSMLEEIELQGIQISDISILKTKSNLTTLFLNNNQISDISVLKTLPNLTRLQSWNNQISDISVLKDLPNLTALNLNTNQISDISVLKALPNLTNLSLSSNQISDISVLKALPNLTELSLGGNKICDISVLKALSNLRKLTLIDAQISDISVLKALPKLTELNLWNNQISDISVLNELLKLKQVELNQNVLKKLPENITEWGLELKWKEMLYDNFKNRVGIYLKDNPLEKPPIEILQEGSSAVRIYFKSLQGEERALHEVKALLVGDGAAGKTSLVKQLLNESFDQHESQTHGISIRDWQVTVEDLNIKVHFWDFGGQEIMHATHQFFLSKRSLYILVLDGRKEEKTEYWLKHIKSFGGDSQVLVVLNKLDENPGFDLNRKFLKDKYPGIVGFYPISCKTRQGIAKFQTNLGQALTKIQILKNIWGKTWFEVKSHLEKMSDNYISYEKFVEICETYQVTEKSIQAILVDYLNDLGVILHFNDLDLEDTHVLQPKWVTAAVYKIINSKQLADCKGVLKLSQLTEILKPQKSTDYVYPRHKHRYLVELMRKFELCYEMDKNTILVPDLLGVQEPNYEFDQSSALKFFFEYDFLPRSIMPRFIIRLHRDIKDSLQWRTGVVLADKSFSATAVVKADEQDKKIQIQVIGEQKRDYFSVIRKTFKDIHASFELLEVTEMVPLPDHPEIAIEYAELIGYEIMNRDEYIVGKLRKTYRVKELLNGLVSERERQDEIERSEGRREHPAFDPPSRPKRATRKPKIERKKLFISYSHQDAKWLVRVQKHLKVLQIEGLSLNIWDDTKIKSGQKWRAEIQTNLKSAKAAILLVSTDFLASNFITKYELPTLLRAAENEGTVVLPVIIRPCRYTKNQELCEFQALNAPETPLSSSSEDEQEQVLMQLVDRIEEIWKSDN